MAIVFVYQSARPGEYFFKSSAVDLGVAWAILSVSVNVVVTVLVVYQIVQVRKQLRGIIPADALSMYTGLSAIIVESALPFSIVGIVYAVTFGKHMAVGPLFLFVWAVFAVSTIADEKTNTTDDSMFVLRRSLPNSSFSASLLESHGHKTLLDRR